MKFRIEYLSLKSRQAYVLARQLDEGNFNLSATSRLGSVPLRPYLNAPRALKTDGSPDMTVFAFYPQSSDLANALTVGEIVELAP